MAGGSKSRKSREKAIAVTQVKAVGAFVEVSEEVRLGVVLERKPRCLWEGTRRGG